MQVTFNWSLAELEALAETLRKVMFTDPRAQIAFIPMLTDIKTKILIAKRPK